MSSDIDPAIEQQILEFVRKRVAHIKHGNRAEIDATYCPCCVNRYNEYNFHDYDLYRKLIEDGFGAVQQISISQPPDFSSLPFRGLSLFCDYVDYVVRISTVSDRQTLWAIRFSDGMPYVCLPIFDGKCFDSIATGTNLRLAGELPTTPIVLQFDEDQFARELSDRIFLGLNHVKIQLRLDRIRAVALDCAPWHALMGLSILTDRECFEDEIHEDKWNTAEWRYSDFTSTPSTDWLYAKDLADFMGSYYETMEDDDVMIDPAKEQIFRACAKALLSDTVAEALEKCGFNLTEDFEFGVFDPDVFDGPNYCDIVRKL